MQIGFPQLKRTVLYGNGRMPPIGHLEDEQIAEVLAFLGGGARPRLRGNEPPSAGLPAGPVVAQGGAPRPPVPQDNGPARNAPVGMQDYPEGVDHPAQRYFTDYGLGYPYLLAPPWSSILAYDLNRGVIKWRRPLGQDRDAVAAGGKNTGVPRGSQRQGMIVTSTGIVFSTARDGVLYAFDAENGEVLWSGELPMGNEGLPAAYQVEGQDIHRGQRHDAAHLGIELARERDWVVDAVGQGWVRGICLAGSLGTFEVCHPVRLPRLATICRCRLLPVR